MKSRMINDNLKNSIEKSVKTVKNKIKLRFFLSELDNI